MDTTQVRAGGGLGGAPEAQRTGVEVRTDAGALILSFSGRLDAPGVSRVWDRAMRAVRADGVSNAVADMGGVTVLNGAGLGLLMEMRLVLEGRGGGLEVTGLSEDQEALWKVNESRRPALAAEDAAPRPGLVERVGRVARPVIEDMQAQVAFCGEALHALWVVARRPGLVRWKDVWLACEKVGADGVPIIVLIGFLMGLILSFQSAVSLVRFGAVLFVPNMLGLVMFREMGALVTAILLAGRSGSSFAAEIGTMKVGEELDALTTMGLDPVRFLVVPKLIAALLMMPLLTAVFIFVSLIGGAVVMLSMGYPLTTFTSRVLANVHMNDFAGGMFKAVVFSLLVAGVGCLRGLRTRSGAGAVGDATTSAVVSGIILIAVADGIFAVAFYYLGI